MKSIQGAEDLFLYKYDNNHYPILVKQCDNDSLNQMRKINSFKLDFKTNKYKFTYIYLYLSKIFQTGNKFIIHSELSTTIYPSRIDLTLCFEGGKINHYLI